jgi:cytidine deaminase
MQKTEIVLTLEEYTNTSELKEQDQILLRYAKKAIPNAYAPYSTFKVAAAARLKNSKILTGTNQENAVFPAGICAERVLLSTIASLFPEQAIEAIAITYQKSKGKSNHPISPCGICRQSLLEYEMRTNNPFRIILSGQEGKIIVVASAKDLLPLSFSANDLEE